MKKRILKFQVTLGKKRKKEKKKVVEENYVKALRKKKINRLLFQVAFCRISEPKTPA